MDAYSYSYYTQECTEYFLDQCFKWIAWLFHKIDTDGGWICWTIAYGIWNKESGRPGSCLVKWCMEIDISVTPSCSPRRKEDHTATAEEGAIVVRDKKSKRKVSERLEERHQTHSKRQINEDVTN